MIKAIILLCVVGTSLCQLGGGGLPGGWHDFHGQIPDAVTAAVKQTLEAENHLQLQSGDLSYTNVRSQVSCALFLSYAYDGGSSMSHVHCRLLPSR